MHRPPLGYLVVDNATLPRCRPVYIPYYNTAMLEQHKHQCKFFVYLRVLYVLRIKAWH